MVYSGGMTTLELERIKKAELQAERWRIAYEVLEEQYLEYAERTTDIVESLQITVSDLLKERNARIDEKFDGKTKNVDNLEIEE